VRIGAVSDAEARARIEFRGSVGGCRRRTRPGSTLREQALTVAAAGRAVVVLAGAFAALRLPRARSPIPGRCECWCATWSRYPERSLTSALPPIGDPESVVRDVLDRVAQGVGKVVNQGPDLRG
jgi:hypothetical protein